jgi:hypothetical protein
MEPAEGNGHELGARSLDGPDHRLDIRELARPDEQTGGELPIPDLQVLTHFTTYPSSPASTNDEALRHLPPITYHPSPITYHPSPITYPPSPITHHLLLTPAREDQDFHSISIPEPGQRTGRLRDYFIIHHCGHAVAVGSEFFQ